MRGLMALPLMGIGFVISLVAWFLVKDHHLAGSAGIIASAIGVAVLGVGLGIAGRQSRTLLIAGLPLDLIAIVCLMDVAMRTFKGVGLATLVFGH